MKHLEDICIDMTTTLSDAIKKLNEIGLKILLVILEKQLVGVVTDGDIRRWILKGGSLDCPISEVMYRNPRVVIEEERDRAQALMLEQQLEAIPVIDSQGIPVDIIFLRDTIKGQAKTYNQISVPVVIMAGGKGTRLSPYTNVLPKPLIPIGSTTIVERIIDSFYKNGCKDFWLTLNYKKNLIKAYFDDKDKPYQINYVEEEDYFGTCGSLSLLEQSLSHTLFVSNCDILLDIDYTDLYEFHIKNRNEMTVVTSLKSIQVPYGVFDLKNGSEIEKITEKPEYSFYVNTGIYVLEASVIKDIPRGCVFHMTDLLNKLLQQNRKVGAYPISDSSWQDMGEIEEMKKMIDSFR